MVALILVEGVAVQETVLKEIYSKLSDIDQKVSALLVKEEKPSKEELRAIQAGKKELAQGKFRSWKKIRIRTE